MTRRMTTAQTDRYYRRLQAGEIRQDPVTFRWGRRPLLYAIGSMAAATCFLFILAVVHHGARARFDVVLGVGGLMITLWVVWVDWVCRRRGWF